ncbi:MAG: radical SAM protein [Nitrososphaerales archaeon]
MIKLRDESLKELTNIYHIVLFKNDQSLYIFFEGCNFNCKGCILKLSPWDCHIPANIHFKLQSHNIEKLSLSQFDSIIGKLSVKKAILGGGEPTVDIKLESVINLLNSYNIYTILLTNGYNLNPFTISKFERLGLKEVCVSIKALNNHIHTQYTGKSNERVLRNFELLNKSTIKLRAESVLIPNLIDINEIEFIAKFIASVNPKIPYRIDSYIQVPNTPWQNAPLNKILKAVELASKYLENVSYIHESMPIKGNVEVIYPKVIINEEFN